MIQNDELKRLLKALKGDTEKIAGDVDRLSKRDDGHEKRLDELERQMSYTRDTHRSLIDCNQAMVRDMGAMRERMESIAGDVSQSIEAVVRSDLRVMRSEQRMGVAALEKRLVSVEAKLDERPCLVDGACNTPLKEK